jgi:hypothetical protein
MRGHVCEVEEALEALRIEKEEGTKDRRRATGQPLKSSAMRKKLGAGAISPTSKSVVKRTGGV